MSSRNLLSISLSRKFCLVISLTVCALLELISARAQNFNEENFNYYYYNNNAGEYLSDWNQNEWGKMSGRSLPSKCVDIPSNLTLCHGIGYTRMLLPNILDHDSLNEVTQQAASWVPLVNINCHPDAKVFLCSLFSPVCLERLIYPCRSLCEGVQANCVGNMKAFGFDWPDMLKCDKFPLDNDMCIKLIHDKKPDNNCSACKHPLTHEAMIADFCRLEVAMRVQIKEFRNVNGNKELILKNKRTFFKGEKLFKNARQLTAVIEGGASCTCQTINSTTERYMLMGIKRDDKVIVKFGMLWNKKDKEFKKGFKAIHKGNTCEGIFREMVVNGETKPPSGTATTQGAKDNGKKPSKNKKGGKNQKPPKKGKQNTKKNKKGNKDKENDKEKMKDKKGKKGKDKVKTTSGNTANRRDTMSKTELEDRALSNFMKVAN